MELYCGMCSRVMPNVAYSVDWGGYICDPCDRKLYEQMSKEQLRFNPLGTLTWGGWR